MKLVTLLNLFVIRLFSAFIVNICSFVVLQVGVGCFILKINGMHDAVRRLTRSARCRIVGLRSASISAIDFSKLPIFEIYTVDFSGEILPGVKLVMK